MRILAHSAASPPSAAWRLARETVGIMTPSDDVKTTKPCRTETRQNKKKILLPYNMGHETLQDSFSFWWPLCTIVCSFLCESTGTKPDLSLSLSSLPGPGIGCSLDTFITKRSYYAAQKPRGILPHKTKFLHVDMRLPIIFVH